MLENIKNIILVLSGKGGVGKSTISTQLSLALSETGLKVGILDIDLCGPSIPYLLGLEGQDIYQGEKGWQPLIYNKNNNQLAVMSIGFLLKNRDDAVIWRGPKKNAMIRQFVNDVNWNELDYLIIDTPPGTSDEHITIMECLKDRSAGTTEALIITTPQQIALDDVRKELTFCQKTNLNVIGIIENMKGYICQHCNTCTNIFSSNGGQALAEMANLPFLGSFPINSKIGLLNGNTSSVIQESPDSETAQTLKKIVDHVLNKRNN